MNTMSPQTRPIADPAFEKALQRALSTARGRLLDRLCAGGYWKGRLSTSALSTAVAVFALEQVDPNANGRLIDGGLDWLAENINPDGGWGDTTDSPSNLSTTLLAWSAFSAGATGQLRIDAVRKAETWLTRKTGVLEPRQIADAVIRYYGNDQTFSAPILVVCALAGRLGPAPQCWRLVPQLPFELAALPRKLAGHLRLFVVSYAIPALVAIGLARHHYRSTFCPARRLLRNVLRAHLVDILEKMQPASGGFLEATPLTGFVVTGLATSGLADHPVVSNGVDFLRSAVRRDGSWPIDVNLSTWVTTLAVNALSAGGDVADFLSRPDREAVCGWLLSQQRPPCPTASPGRPSSRGWAWTDLPGGVPDADDTAGAIIALRRLSAGDERTRQAATAGVAWLLGVQNSDGGFPTFCRGWGKLPFDRSCPDITAHAVGALAEWIDDVETPLAHRIDRAISRAVGYLVRTQREDGSWVPLWFGNQDAPDSQNPTYGTARVVTALMETANHVGRLKNGRLRQVALQLAQRGRGWLLSAQNAEGGWGGAGGVTSSVEETALAIGALATFEHKDPQALRSGATWLVNNTNGGEVTRPAPIGLYFASLWYSEELYPLIFTVSALGRVLTGAAF